ncbi:MAG TPA: penicillin-binding protein 2 [Propionibacteriaceae bacterium]|nr:penicillin-binding protein 2 [Propionibacteriaceae bacterium]
MAIAVSLCGGRLLQLQGFNSSAYAAASAGQLTRTLPLLPSRGDITDRNGLVMASTEAAVAITADPKLTTERAGEIAEVLATYLDIDQAKMVGLLTKPNTRFVYLKKKVPAAIYTKIAADLSQRDIYGIFRENDPIRTYPGGSVGGGLVGFVGADGKGLAGLERSLNTELAGVEGQEKYESAPNGSKIPLGASVTTPATNGLNYQLTIDSELQWMAERRLAAQVKKAAADYGFAITINIKTGEILAMANAPTVDSANPSASEVEDRDNRAITQAYEPGSVQKVLTAAALIDATQNNPTAKRITPETRVKIPSLLPSGGGRIKDHFSHGTVRYLMRGVMADSSNIGMALLARQVDKATIHHYLTSFGLGARTGIEGPGEATGEVPGADMADYTRDQIAFGQGLSVTGVQEAAALAGILNDGSYHPPTLVKAATDSNGKPVDVARPPARQIVSAATSAHIRDLMQAVVDSRNGRANLSLEGYQSGGKTGTAQRYEKSCGCYRGYVTSYVGFAPLNDPELLTYVVVNNPRSGDTGTSVSAPVYRDVMQLALPRYSVEPTTKRIKAKETKW